MRYALYIATLYTRWEIGVQEILEPAQGHQIVVSVGILNHPLVWLETFTNLQHDCMGVLSSVQLFVTLWTVACQTPLSMGFFQARILEWVAISFCRGSSWPRDRTCISYIPTLLGRFFTLSHQGPGKFSDQTLFNGFQEPSTSLDTFLYDILVELYVYK